MQAANQADIDRVISITFTPMERDAVLHRLHEGDLFEQVFSDTDGLEHLASGAEDRARALAAALEADGAVMTINGTELDAETVREAIEGSTWNGVHNNNEVSVQRRAAARALDNAARKVEAALGLPELDIKTPEA